MSKRVTIKPASGRKIRKPRSLHWLRATGEDVVWSPFWQRRLDAGDVVLIPAPRAPDVTTSAKRQPKKESGE